MRLLEKCSLLFSITNSNFNKILYYIILLPAYQFESNVKLNFRVSLYLVHPFFDLTVALELHELRAPQMILSTLIQRTSCASIKARPPVQLCKYPHIINVTNLIRDLVMCKVFFLFIHNVVKC